MMIKEMKNTKTRELDKQNNPRDHNRDKNIQPKRQGNESEKIESKEDPSDDSSSFEYDLLLRLSKRIKKKPSSRANRLLSEMMAANCNPKPSQKSTANGSYQKPATIGNYPWKRLNARKKIPLKIPWKRASFYCKLNGKSLRKRNPTTGKTAGEKRRIK